MAAIKSLDVMPQLPSASPSGVPRIIDVENFRDIADWQDVDAVTIPDMVATLLYRRHFQILEEFLDSSRDFKLWRGDHHSDFSIVKSGDIVKVSIHMCLKDRQYFKRHFVYRIGDGLANCWTPLLFTVAHSEDSYDKERILRVGSQSARAMLCNRFWETKTGTVFIYNALVRPVGR